LNNTNNQLPIAPKWAFANLLRLKSLLGDYLTFTILYREFLIHSGENQKRDIRANVSPLILNVTDFDQTFYQTTMIDATLFEWLIAIVVRIVFT